MEINSSPISYRGLNRTLSKRIFDPYNAEILDALNPKSKGITGNIPPQWVKNMPQEQRGELIPKLYQSIGKFVSGILPKLPGTKLQSAILTHILKKTKAISKDTSVKIKKIGQGALSDGYKIEHSDGTALFLKRFKETRKNRGLRETGIHGPIPENNVKTFLKHDLKTNKEKELFSKYYYGDIHNGYYVEEYLSRKDSLPQDAIAYEFRSNVKSDIYQTLWDHNLRHQDLHDFNVKYYFDKKENVKVKCFDLGGVVPSNVL